MFYRIFLLSLLGLKISCDSKEKQPPYAPNPIARVHNQYLYKQDIAHLVPADTNPQDSLELVGRYIQNWLAKQLLASQAEVYENNHPSDIEKKVAEFRSALVTHNYIQKLVSEKLNKQVSEEGIISYYETNQDDFRLKHNIVKGKFIIIPKNAPNIQNLKKLIISTEEADLLEIQTYCSQFAKDYSLDEKVWLKWDDLITKTPFRKIPDKTRLLKRTSFTEVQDQLYRYYLKIDAYKIINDIAPLELVKDQIVNVIIYKRKIELINQIKQDILEQAKANNDYIIYESTN
ncbi:MAG: hypothetical protein BGO68_01660 [Candidatus Amoebophilus sp. 36-38]|nr:MAG: hypothetical protein BGO68_01660 [Candidatus Amoebophilus sp. 36-38]